MVLLPTCDTLCNCMLYERSMSLEFHDIRLMKSGLSTAHCEKKEIWNLGWGAGTGRGCKQI